MSAPPQASLTDRATLARHRARAARAPELFLHEITAEEIKERLIEVNRSFTAPAIIAPEGPAAAIWRDLLPEATLTSDAPVLDLQPGAHDLVVHAMSLHWADDPLGQIIQCRRALRPDGLFIAAFFGGRSLHELRAVLAQAESDLTGSLSPRVLPMADIRDAGALLQRAGLALPVADRQITEIRYRSLRALARDLRAMGEGNALASRRRASMSRALMQHAEALYRKHHADEQGRLRATVETLFLTGWAPDASQPQPLRPGSATTRLAEALDTTETPLEPAPGAPARPKSP